MNTPMPAPKRPDFKTICERCGSYRVTLAKQIACNGAVQVFWWCNSCKQRARRNGGAFIKHSELTVSLDDIPTLEDNAGYQDCVVCGSPYAEYHHWAPRHLFENYNDWPGAYLCIPCHLLWHSIVTPEMSKVRK